MLYSRSRSFCSSRLAIIGFSGIFLTGFVTGLMSSGQLQWPSLAQSPLAVAAGHGTLLTEATRPRAIRLAEAASRSHAPTGQALAIEQLEVRPEPVQLAALARDLGPDFPQGSGDDTDYADTLHSAAVVGGPSADHEAATLTTHIVERGDTLGNILIKAGLEPDHAHHAISALTDHFDPRTLQPGQEVKIALSPTNDASVQPALQQLVLDLDFANELQLKAATDGYEIAKQERILERRTRHVAAPIEGSLFLAAQQARIPAETVVDLVMLFSWDIDFQREIQPHHGFELIFEELSAPGRDERRGGPVLYARLDLGDRQLQAHRFQRADGMVGYYDPNGRSVRKQFMRTPVDGARLSSGFGRRKHPILGYTRMHKGVDFAAPTGTPVFAAGDGMVEVAGRNGGYGNYVRLRHNREYSTAYAHLHRYAKGIRPGVRVEQGQIIGYVGSTGRSTGPHLHYEVLQHGQQINPMAVKSDVVEHLEGDDLKRFQAQIRDFEAMRQRAEPETILARRQLP